MKKPHRMKGLGVFEIAMCENPANEGSRVVLYKSNPRLAIMKYMGELCGAAQTGAQNFEAIYQRAEAERKRWQASEELWPAFSALQDALRSIAGDDSLNQAGKLSRINESVTQFLAAVKDKLPDVEQELAKALSAVTKAEERTGDQQEEGSMPGPEDKIAALETQNAELTKTNAKLADDLAKAKQDEKAAKDEAESMKKAIEVAKTDETLEYEGTTIRKSDSPGNFAVIKSLVEKNELAEFTKTAEGLYKALPGEAIEKAKALRDMKKALPEASFKAAEAMLKAGAAAQAELMKATGSGGPAGGVSGDAEAKLDALAKTYAATNKMSFSKAYDAVLETDEGRELYKAQDQERRRQQRAA